MASDFIFPIAPLELSRQTIWNPPSYQEQSDSVVISPPGPQGPGDIVDSPFHFPAKTSSFLASGPGLGISVCWLASAALAAKHTPARPRLPEWLSESSFHPPHLLVKRRCRPEVTPSGQRLTAGEPVFVTWPSMIVVQVEPFSELSALKS